MTGRYQGQTILVTGGAGFIGSHLVRTLLAQGARVVNIDDYNAFYDPAIKEANTRAFRQNPDQYTEYRIDLANSADVTRVFDEWGPKLDQVVHLAARAGVRPSLEQPQLYLQTNVTGTLNVLEAMRPYSVRKMVFASSSSVYGNRTDPPFREDQDISKPISPYAATKAMCENMLHTYCHLYGFNVVALRFFTVYGAGQRPDLAIHKFAKLITEGKTIPMYGDGSTLRDYTYIADILQGILGAMDYAQPGFEVFNLGESDPVSLTRLITTLEDVLGQKVKIDPQPMQPGDVLMTCADISKAKAKLGYNPTTSIEEGLKHFADWFRQTYPQAMSISAP